MSNNIQKQNIFHSGKIIIGYNEPSESLEGPDMAMHLSWFTSYPYTGTNLKDGQVVVDGIDYELEYQFFVGNPLDDDSWKTTDSREYYLAFDSIKKRILTIPKEQPTEKKEEMHIDSQSKMFYEILCMYNEVIHGKRDERETAKEILSKFTITRK